MKPTQPRAVLVVGETLSPAAMDSLRRAGLAVVLSPLGEADVPLSLTPSCIIVCSHNGNGPDLCNATEARPGMRGIPMLLAYPSGDLHAGGNRDRGAGNDLGARVLSVLHEKQVYPASVISQLTDAEQFRMLAEAGRGLLSCLHPAEYVKELFSRIYRRLHVDLYLNYLLDEKSGRLRLNSYGGLPPEAAHRVEWLALGEAVCGTVAREQKSMAVERVQQSVDPRTELIRSLGIQAYACFPLMGEHGFRGTVSFGSRVRSSFLTSELDLMAGVADLAGIALERFALLAALEEKAKALEASNRDLEEFAFAVSHDLREPLRSISAFTDLLARRTSLSPDTETSQLIGFIKSGTQRMGEVIEAVLRFSRANSGPPDAAEVVDLGSVAGEAITNLSSAIGSAEAEIVVDALPKVHGDRTLLLQLLQNLIENAVKYRGPETPQIHIGYAEKTGETALFVRDNGIGIAPAAHATIFGIFKRLHSHEQYSGAGIGLAVAKKIVERHGGRIWVESAPGQGSTFWFTLPMQRITTAGELSR